MQSVFRGTQRLSQAWLRSSKTGIPSVAVSTRPPLYQRVPPWWAQWTLGLIACDIFMTCSAVDLTWNRWSVLVTDSEKKQIKDGEIPTTSPTPDYFVPRPMWQRLGLCSAHIALGAAVAAALVVTQARLVRTVAFLPSTKTATASGTNRRVFLQCAHNWKRNGLVFPFDKCSLEQGRNETEIIFRVAGERGHWHINLDGTFINGQPVSVAEARAAFLEQWGDGKRIGQWAHSKVTDSRWKSGPVRRAT